MSQEYAAIGGAKFIESHISHPLIKNGKISMVVDFFCFGTISHIGKSIRNLILEIKELDLEDTAKLYEAIKGSGVVSHLASEPNITRDAHEPRFDPTKIENTRTVSKCTSLEAISNEINSMNLTYDTWI